MKRISILLGAVFLITSLSSCVSKKKYTELETKYNSTTEQLDRINARVEAYYTRIQSLQTDSASLEQKVKDNQFDYVENVAHFSRKQKQNMNKLLSNVDPAKLAQAETVEDSINLALSYQLSKKLEDSDGIDVEVDKTVVMITVSNDLLFNPGSYKISDKADPTLEKIARVINEEQTVDVLVEGHTDSTPIKKSSVEDNWELSSQRALSVVREFKDEYGVSPEHLISSARSSYAPIAPNDTSEGRALNRRIRIVLIPDLDKFFAMLAEEEIAAVDNGETENSTAF